MMDDWRARSLERALGLNADHTEGWLLYGRLLEALGYLAEGLAAKQRVLERDPSSATVHLQIALSYWNSGCETDDASSGHDRTLMCCPEGCEKTQSGILSVPTVRRSTVPNFDVVARHRASRFT